VLTSATKEAKAHAVLAACGVPVVMSDLFGAGGQALLERVVLVPAFRARVNSARRVIEALDFEIELFTNLVGSRLRGHGGYAAIQAISGVGPILAAVFVAEIGDVHRFRRAGQLVRNQVAQRRGRNIGKVAARELIELIFYGLRDGHIRCLDRRGA
jgi:transposase